jgi:hypothetical protein
MHMEPEIPVGAGWDPLARGGEGVDSPPSSRAHAFLSVRPATREPRYRSRAVWLCKVRASAWKSRAGVPIEAVPKRFEAV